MNTVSSVLQWFRSKVLYRIEFTHIQSRTLTLHTHTNPPYSLWGFCPVRLPFSPRSLRPPLSHPETTTTPIFVVLPRPLSSLWLISALPPSCIDAICVLSGSPRRSLQPAKLMACIPYLMAPLYHCTGCRLLRRATKSYREPLWAPTVSSCTLLCFISNIQQEASHSRLLPVLFSLSFTFHVERPAWFWSFCLLTLLHSCFVWHLLHSFL